jgi:phosphatidate cytidylyltransferase
MKQGYIFLIVFVCLLMGQIYWSINFKKISNIKQEQEKTNEWVETISYKFLTNLGKRLKISWVLFVIIGIAFLLGFVGLVIFFSLVSFLAFREFVSVMHLKASDYWPIFCAFYIFLPLQYIFVLIDAQFLFFIFIPVYVFLLSPISSVLAEDDEYFFERASKFQWAQIACIYCLSYLPAIAGLSLKDFESTGLLIYFMMVIMFSDSLQYVFGNWLGKKKVAPKLSPNKTWEGTIYGIFAASLIGLFLYKLTPFNMLQSFAISLIISITGFFGGLVMSGIKRSLKIKDWGDILGAHGGILDRFDSMIFAAPLFYHMCQYFFK